ncbi:MAG: hypothetical protein ACI9FG_000386 [Crocinitomicaceae bacterium]|jgi:hypothetical protein
MKLAVIFITLLFFNLQAVAQDWYFTGVRTYTDLGTVNKQPTKYGYSWILKDKDKTANQKLFKEAAKKADKSASITYKSSSSYNFVAIYKITVDSAMWKGNKKKRVSYFKFFAGKDVDQIERNLASDTKLYHYIASECYELIDLQKKKTELNQQKKNPVLGRPIH